MNKNPAEDTLGESKGRPVGTIKLSQRTFWGLYAKDQWENLQ